MPASRQLAAIMFTDIAGYTALMGESESRAFELLQQNRQLQKPIIAARNGKFIKELGDGILASFNTVSDAVNAALQILAGCSASGSLHLHIGIHLGEVVFEDDDVFGDGVNIASRIQALAPADEIYVSETVYNNISNKAGITATFVNEVALKNVKQPVRIYKIGPEPSSNPRRQPVFHQPKKPVQKSIAVLPFVNMSNDQEQEYFSDGMAEEIINSLAHLQDLKVAGRTSCFQFKGKNVDLREIGNLLGVTSVLEGSVRKHGNRLRITVQLIDIEDGFHLWSEKYDRDIEDVFAIQDEIALAITEKLKVTLLGNDRKLITKVPTENAEAYQFYLKGRYSTNRRNDQELRTAIHYFQKAIEKDPQYALAWAGLSDAYNLLGEYGKSPRLEIYTKAKEAAIKALELDDEVAEAHISLASLLMLDEWAWENAGHEFRLGVQSNPNYVLGHHWYSEWLMYTGHTDEALHEISLASELDPVSPAILKDKGLIYYYNRQYDEAIAVVNIALDLDPYFASANRVLSLSWLGKGRYDLAIAENEKWQKLTQNSFRPGIARALIHAVSGQHHEALKMLEGFSAADLENGKDYRGVALVYGALGRIDKAFELLQLSYEKHEVGLCSLRIDPKSDPLRADPRFHQIIKGIGF